MIKTEPDRRWAISKEWEGETAVIIGGGPSLKQEQVNAAVSRGWRRIAVNNAYLLDPEADALVWGDPRWYFWNRHDLVKHTGQYKIAWQYVPPTPGIKFYLLRHVKRDAPPLAEDPGSIVATNTGQGAMNVAFHFGIRRIILLGFDMQLGHRNGKLVHNWHDLHQRETAQTRYLEVFAPSIRRATEWLKQRGVEVINCTKGSKLHGIRIMELDQVK